MKSKRPCPFCDEICGRENEDYIAEFSPHRLSFIRLEEVSEEIFEADEHKTSPRNVKTL